ncbi:MAG: FixH family protein [Ferruginibacter sp.]
MSWGYKILLAYTVFIGAMLFMVYTASKQTNEMEDERYYVKELKFQEVIDAKNNLYALGEKLSIQESPEGIIITFPVVSLQHFTGGKIEVMRSSDKSKDFTVDIHPAKNGQQLIEKTKFVKGAYKFRVHWTGNALPYYAEESFYIK